MSHPGFPLVARTRALTPTELVAFDPLQWAGADGFLHHAPGLSIVGRGVAMRLGLSQGLGSEGDRKAVLDELRSLRIEDDLGRPGSGPVAMGALPFDSRAPASLVVPELLVVRKDDGSGWFTTVTAGDRVPSEPLLEPELPPPLLPDQFTLNPLPSHAEWLNRISDAVDAIREGPLEKVVLARKVVVEANRPIAVADVLERLAMLYPSCTIYSFEGFVGASPELLVRKSGPEVTSFPLAGTIPHSGDLETDARAAAAMLASAKERHEHEVAARAVAEALREICEEVTLPALPSVVSLRNVSHLGTELRARLRQSSKETTVLDLAAALHPTPAVAGTPTDEALSWIGKLEDSARGNYAGPVGWMDSRGDGEMVLGIRCALVEGSSAQLFAGVGVVADSDPALELAETQLKLQALLAAIVRP